MRGVSRRDAVEKPHHKRYDGAAKIQACQQRADQEGPDTMTQNTSPTARDKASATAITGTYLQSFIERTDQWGLGLHHFAMMLHLQTHGEVYQVAWPEITGSPPTTVSHHLQELGTGRFPNKKAGPQFVELEQDPVNRRLNITRLTPLGKAVLDEAATAAARYLPSRT